MKQSVRLGLFALLLGTLFLAPFCTIRSYAQSAPLTSPNVSSSITVTFKHGADETTKAHIRKAIRNLASKGVVPDGTHFYLNNAILSSSTSTTGQVGGSANNGGNQSGAQIGASVAQGGTQTGAGIIPSYLLAGKGYSLLLGLNTASTKSIGQDASSSTNNATSASALGATLLNPGTNTQSFNFIFLFEIGSRFKPQPPTGLTATINGNKVTLNWNQSLGATSYTVNRSEANEDSKPIAKGLQNTTYDDADITKGATYHYTVTAFSGNIVGGKSREISVTIPAVVANPSPPVTPSGTTQVHALLLEMHNLIQGSQLTTESAMTNALGTPNAADSATEVITTTVTDHRFGIYARLGVSTLELKGTDPAMASSAKSISGQLFAPAVGLQYLLGGTGSKGSVQAGIEIGYTWRIFSGDIGAQSNQAFLGQNFGASSSAGLRTQYSSPEFTLFLAAGSIHPYIRWTNFNGDGPRGFAGGTWTVGLDIFARFF